MRKAHEYIALAKQGVKPEEIARRFLVSLNYVYACLRMGGVQINTPMQKKKAALVKRCREGASCEEMAKEFGYASPYYVYRVLRDMGENPPAPKSAPNKLIGGKRMSRECPRVVKMIGDLKRGKDTGWMRDKYGVCRERVNQVRAYGIEAGLLERDDTQKFPS